MKRWILAVLIGFLILGTAISGCETKKEEKKEELPGAIFSSKNHSDMLANATQNDNVATITLTEGKLTLSKIRIMISNDGDTYLELTDYELMANDESTVEWNTGGALMINEAKVPTGVLDANGNWGSDQFYIQVFYIPLDEKLYSSQITLEPSM